MEWFKRMYMEFFAWVARIPHDKLLHYCLGMSLMAMLALFPFELTRNAGFMLVIAVAILKECLDDVVKGKGSGSVADILVTGAGAMLVQLVVYMTEYAPFAV